ncbi:MAG: hypothetical protein H5T34_03300 [Candidatus Methanomethyliales bacterium]|nr:hypothetical protein [Candidatus Methanomethylicales archaeon]
MGYQRLEVEHYSRVEVQREIAEFCRARWVAAHVIDKSGKLVFRRYIGRRPITIKSQEDLVALSNRLRAPVRAIYATANKYPKIERVEDVDLSKAHLCTPTWDIDGRLQEWQETIAVAKEIITILRDEGVEKSVYLKWSGNGCHIHIHEGAISESVIKRAHPLDFAYAIVDYVNMRLAERVAWGLKFEGIRVENKMDAGRVFTCPLSLHRQLDVVCVCLKPDQVDDFTPDWIKPLKFRHNPEWRIFEEGEADSLAIKAYETVGGYSAPSRRGKSLDQLINEWLRKF